MKSVLFGYFLSPNLYCLFGGNTLAQHELPAVAGFRILGNLVIAIQLKFVYCLVAFPDQILAVQISRP